MKVTSKGQVTIPRHIRDKLGICSAAEVDFLEESGRVYLVVKNRENQVNPRFSKLRGVASAKMSTAEIMDLTRGDK